MRFREQGRGASILPALMNGVNDSSLEPNWGGRGRGGIFELEKQKAESRNRGHEPEKSKADTKDGASAAVVRNNGFMDLGFDSEGDVSRLRHATLYYNY